MKRRYKGPDGELYEEYGEHIRAWKRRIQPVLEELDLVLIGCNPRYLVGPRGGSGSTATTIPLWLVDRMAGYLGARRGMRPRSKRALDLIVTMSDAELEQVAMAVQLEMGRRRDHLRVLELEMDSAFDTDGRCKACGCDPDVEDCGDCGCHV